MRPAAKSSAARSAAKPRRRAARTAAPKPYHHGDLRRVLIDAALQLVGEGGPDAVSVREAARRAQCQSNIKNVSLALLNYESAKKTFPNGMNFDTKHTSQVHILPQYQRNWIIDVLPYLEEQALHDSFDFSKPINDNTTVAKDGSRSTGSGEPGLTAVPSAIANAFFDATGVRIREMPMTPARVRGVLSAAGKLAK